MNILSQALVALVRPIGPLTTSAAVPLESPEHCIWPTWEALGFHPLTSFSTRPVRSMVQDAIIVPKKWQPIQSEIDSPPGGCSHPSWGSASIARQHATQSPGRSRSQNFRTQSASRPVASSGDRSPELGRASHAGGHQAANAGSSNSPAGPDSSNASPAPSTKGTMAAASRWNPMRGRRLS